LIRRYTLKGWMTMNRETMLSDLAQLGINGLDKLADAGVKKMHDKWFPKHVVNDRCLVCGWDEDAPVHGLGVGMRHDFAPPITPEQVDDALDAITKQEER
jgi:hypothetical protein